MYSNNCSNIRGIPTVPKYKREEKYYITFSKYAIRIRNNNLLLSISKEMKLQYGIKAIILKIPNKLREIIKNLDIKQIKIKNSNSKYSMVIIYQKQEINIDNTYSNIMAIDLGLNNIAALTNKDNNNTLLIDGRKLKSINRYYNEAIRKQKKLYFKILKEKYDQKNTKIICKLYKKRSDYIKTYLHKVSKIIIKYAIENYCKIIIIGDWNSIKQRNKRNKSFSEIPYEILIKDIEYKAKLQGLKVEKISEKYTSGISSIDEEPINKEYYNIKRRIVRGIFITNRGKMINSDINGSLNILRKYINSKTKLEIAMNNGREQSPIKKMVT